MTNIDSSTQSTIDQAITSMSAKATYAGSASTVFGWLLSSEFAVLMGIILGVAGLIVNIYYKKKEDARAQAWHDLQVQKLKTDALEPPNEGN